MLNWIIWNKTVLTFNSVYCQVAWGNRIHRVVSPSPATSVLDMTLNNQMVRFQWCWSFGEYGALLHSYISQCCILTFDPAKYAIQKWCTRRKWHIPMASNQKKSHRQIWLTKWDKVKAHDTLIDWCTRREWPLNCMTVISTWWPSNMPFQRLSGRLNYYITRWGQEVRRVGGKMW